MADLSTLDATAPGATDAVSSGDDAIRATREAVKTSFGGTDSGSGTQLSEHYLKGAHKFPYGAPASRPTAGNAGRLFFDTTNGRIERDTGAAWVLANAVQVGMGECSAALTLTSSYQDIPGMTVTLDVPTGGRITISGTVRAEMSLAGNLTTIQVLVGGAAVWDKTSPGNVAACDIPIACAVLAPSAGSTIVKVQAKVFSASGTRTAGTSGTDQLVVVVG